MRIDLHAPTRAESWLSAMEAGARDGLARLAQREASRLGLRFVRSEGPRDIPLVLSPVALPRAQLDELGRSARLLTSALVKVARDVIERRPERARLLFAHLSALEERALASRWREAEELLIARVDWFVDRAGSLRALEINATIPAMPVYSDAAARGWLSAAAPARAAALAASNGSNAAWLVDAILAAASRAGRELDVQILHRERDPQISELESLAALLERRGARARTVTPAQVALGGAGVIYRHLFARYVEPDTALGAALLDPVRHGIWNRVDGWLEVKGLFAELSSAAAERPALFDADELAALRAHVPWTRLLDDAAEADLARGIVLKKSNDYGGKSVLVGRDVGAAELQAALAAARRDPPGTWVVQELVDSPAAARWICREGGAERLPLHLDISTYASLVPGVPVGGSVCRGAPGSVVNIVGGGGVAPLFAERSESVV